MLNDLTGFAKTKCLAVSSLILLMGSLSFAQGPPAFDDGGLDGFGGLTPTPKLSVAARHFKLRAVAHRRVVEPGGSLRVALVCELDDGWVYYSPDPGPIVLAGTLEVQAGPMTVRQVRWPADKPKSVNYGDGPVFNNVYAH